MLQSKAGLDNTDLILSCTNRHCSADFSGVMLIYTSGGYGPIVSNGGVATYTSWRLESLTAVEQPPFTPTGICL